MELSVDVRRVEAAKKVAYAMIHGGKIPSVFSSMDVAKIKKAHRLGGMGQAVKSVLKMQQKRIKAISIAQKEMVFARRVLATKGLTARIVKKAPVKKSGKK